MYTLFADKSEDFKCNIGVEGADLASTQARLVLESSDVNLLFEGTINSDGSCTIPIKKLKNHLKEGDSGNMKLEVIADGTFFSPWSDSYNVKVSKKVTVEVAGDSKKETITDGVKVRVEGIEQPNNKEQQKTAKLDQVKRKVLKNKTRKVNHGKVLAEALKRKGINKTNIIENSDKVVKVIDMYSKKMGIKDSTDKTLTEILDNL